MNIAQCSLKHTRGTNEPSRTHTHDDKSNVDSQSVDIQAQNIYI